MNRWLHDFKRARAERRAERDDIDRCLNGGRPCRYCAKRQACRDCAMKREGVNPLERIADMTSGSPSALVELAQARNPGIDVEMGYDDRPKPWGTGQPLVLKVKTARGTVYEHRDGHDTWYDVFRRAGLLD